MRRSSVAAAMAAVLLAGCGASQLDTQAPGGPGLTSTPTPTAVDTPAATPDLLALSVDAYKAIAAKDQPALDAASQALQSAGTDATQQQAALAMLADALTTYEGDLQATSWPTFLSPKTDAVIAAVDRFARLAKGAAAGDALAIQAALPALQQAELDEGAAIAVLRAALHIP